MYSFCYKYWIYYASISLHRESTDSLIYYKLSQVNSISVAINFAIIYK